MTARHCIAFSLFLGACAGAPSVPAPSTSPAAADDSPRASPTRAKAAGEAALACARALLAGQDQRVLDCLPAAAVAALGGRDSAVGALTSAKTMNDKSVSIEAVDVLEPRQIASGGRQLYVVVPQEVTLKAKAGHFRTHGFLLAVSDDGTSWKVVDGDVLKPDLRAAVFPDLPSDLALPAGQSPERLP
jgi:hypothetical protein